MQGVDLVIDLTCPKSLGEPGQPIHLLGGSAYVSSETERNGLMLGLKHHLSECPRSVVL